jgi:membrane-associated PAP2 superfamily phosphatase
VSVLPRDTASRAAVALVLAIALAQGAFTLAPGLDLAVAGWFHDPDRGFWLRDAPALNALRRAAMAAVWIVGLPALALWPTALLRPTRLGARPFAFVVLGLALGPGLLVNGLLKEHWGRARPAEIAEFGGTAAFTPPFRLADQCATNCSFTSGEAASAATLAMLVLVLFWPRATPRGRAALLAAAAPAALAVGLLRMAFGRHYLSDVLFSVLLCALVLALLHKLLGLSRHPGLTLADLRADAAGALGALPRAARALWRPRSDRDTLECERPGERPDRLTVVTNGGYSGRDKG